jgi:hypothetical protein
MVCDLGEPWVTRLYNWDNVPEDLSGEEWKSIEGTYAQFKNNIIISHTERYINPYITYNFLKDYTGKLIFVGTKKEHQLFCDQNKLQFEYLDVPDFLYLARAINACKFFIGNASFCWHLADSMKVPRILEYCSQFPNSAPTGKNGYQFLTQQALEYYFNKLLKQ